jgi:tropinone reductase I
MLLAVCRAHGPIHGLVNNVGVNVRKSITHQTTAEYDTIFRTNIDAAYYFTRDLYTHQCFATFTTRPGGGGGAAIVNVTSAAGLASSGTGIAYAMSKAALNQFTKTLAMEWASSGIRVNAVAPWMTMTPLLEHATTAGGGGAAALANATAYTPLRRLALPHEIAGPVAFLLLDASSYVTGQILAVDGGLTAQGYPGPCVQSYDHETNQDDADDDADE